MFNSKWISAIKYVQYQTSRKKKLSLDARLGFCFNTKTGLNLYDKWRFIDVHLNHPHCNLVFMEGGITLVNLNQTTNTLNITRLILNSYGIDIN